MDCSCLGWYRQPAGTSCPTECSCVPFETSTCTQTTHSRIKASPTCASQLCTNSFSCCLFTSCFCTLVRRSMPSRWFSHSPCRLAYSCIGLADAHGTVPCYGNFKTLAAEYLAARCGCSVWRELLSVERAWPESNAALGYPTRLTENGFSAPIGSLVRDLVPCSGCLPWIGTTLGIIAA